MRRSSSSSPDREEKIRGPDERLMCAASDRGAGTPIGEPAAGQAIEAPSGMLGRERMTGLGHLARHA